MHDAAQLVARLGDQFATVSDNEYLGIRTVADAPTTDISHNGGKHDGLTGTSGHLKHDIVHLVPQVIDLVFDCRLIGTQSRIVRLYVAELNGRPVKRLHQVNFLIEIFVSPHCQ